MKPKKADAATCGTDDTAISNDPPPSFRIPEAPPFLTPTHANFDACLATSYGGFALEASDALPAAFHQRFRSCLHQLQSTGVLDRRDITQPMGAGTALAPTRVTRCLIGKPGITYKYLGLRMFAHPWRGSSATAACQEMRALSRTLEQRAESCGAPRGRSGFNLTLLNRMEPGASSGAKVEKDYGMGAVSVNWHADSSLQDFSTISVYVAQHPVAAANFDDPAPPPKPPRARPWKVALRVVHEAEGPSMRASATWSGKRDRDTPAVLVPLHDGDAYHMVGPFNHHHQHAVIQPAPASASEGDDGGDGGDGEEEVRYSSTHRVAVEEGHTLDSVRRRALAALATAEAATSAAPPPAATSTSGQSSSSVSPGVPSVSPGDGAGTRMGRVAAQWSEEQACLDMLEFEWIRQFYVQGAAHRDGLPWWTARLSSLEELWLGLERLTRRRVESMRGLRGRSAPPADGLGAEAREEVLERVGVLHAALERRQRMRSAWAQRERDPIFDRLEDGYRPLPCLYAADAMAPERRLSGTLPVELSPVVAELADMREALRAPPRKKRKACYQLARFGVCRIGATCPFAHPTP